MTQPINDLLVQSRFKNRILFDAMAGRPVREIATASGVHEHTIYKLLSLSLSPVGKNGTYRTGAQKLAEFFCMLPEDLFPATLYALNLPRVVEREYSSEVVLKRLTCREAMALPAPDGLKAFDLEERDAMIKKVLKTLTPREERVITMRFGLDGNGEHTLEQVGNAMIGPVSGKPTNKEYVRHIEIKALRKLRHPARSQALRIFLDGE
jgi:hypothetical protein